MKARISKEAREKRLKEMLRIRDEVLKDINSYHVRIMRGNSKTGKDCWTVSTIPIIDCYNCKECMIDCYDINTDCRFPAVLESRAINSAIHKADRARYFQEISDFIKANHITELRYNVGGDFCFDDFIYVKLVAEQNPECDFLFFTKSYSDINTFLSKSNFPTNVHPIISRWLNVECNNAFNLPESHVLYEDGRTTAPEYSSYLCTGNCSNCHYDKSLNGCWYLKNGESVTFVAH